MKKLIKDIIFASIFAGIAVAIYKTNGSTDTSTLVSVIWAGAGIPCGWKLASKVVTAISFEGVLLKLLGALLLGIFALPIVVVMDIISAIAESHAAKKAA